MNKDKEKKSRGILRFFRNVLIGFLAVLLVAGIAGFVLWRLAMADMEGRRRGQGGDLSLIHISAPRPDQTAASRPGFCGRDGEYLY